MIIVLKIYVNMGEFVYLINIVMFVNVFMDIKEYIVKLLIFVYIYCV